MAVYTDLPVEPAGDTRRRYPLGAEPVSPTRTSFRVWARDRNTVDVVLGDDSIHPLAAEPDGYFSGEIDAPAGTTYWFRLDGDKRRPDPVSRFQPEGPHGPSQVVDAAAFRWTDQAWPGLRKTGQVIYELHVGTFTREGTFAAARRELPRLRDLGVTVLELMPVAEFSGRYGWGYDGVNLFAPTRLYGTPDDLRGLIDAAHGIGLGVILDVVYNHLGSDGNYLADFCGDYCSSKHTSEWGASLNFDGDACEVARRLVCDNAAYWIADFHFDGLRLDATQQIYDDSPDHIIGALARSAVAAGGSRSVYLCAETETQDSRLVRDWGVHAMWNDDLHHSVHVALTEKREGYYLDHMGSPQEFVSAAKYGFLYQGQWYDWQEHTRGSPALDLEPADFISFIENHDQVANSLHGQRAHELGSPGRYRALLALILLGPHTPMLFMGQEFASESPFLFFVDVEGELAENVRRGRRQFLTQFQGLATPDVFPQVGDPTDPATFERCRIAPGRGAEQALSLHRDLLALRRNDGIVAVAPLDGAVIGPQAFVLRYFGPDNDDRLLLVNLGADLLLRPSPEPLLAPPRGQCWEVAWSSEQPTYGGSGTPPVADREWWIPGAAAVLLRPVFPGT